MKKIKDKILFRIFTGSCGSTLVPQQPINNIVRVAMHALMGILGGNQAIDKNENLMPHIIEAVKSYATLGEICGVMRKKWGEFQASTYI